MKMIFTHHKKWLLKSVSILISFIVFAGCSVSDKNPAILIEYGYHGMMIKESDSPAGVYMVFNGDTEKQQIVQLMNNTAKPYSDFSKIFSGMNELVTNPRNQYLKNQSLSLLKSENVGKIILSPFDAVYGKSEFKLNAETQVFYQPEIKNEADFLVLAIETKSYKMKKIAVVGFGFMGLTHTINILENPELELVAIVDKNPENIRKNMTEQVGNFSTGTLSEEVVSKIKIYTDLKDCIADETPDIFVIAVHTNLHYELTKMSLNAGANVFLEKPFCLEVSEGKELIELAAEKNLLLMIGHVVRFMPAYQKLKKWVDSGEFGNLKFLSLSRFSGVPAWGQWKEKQQDFGSSGGALFDLVIHDIDFVQWLLGSPESIDSTCLSGKLSSHDYVNAMCKYPSGVTAKIEGGNIFHTSFPFRAGYIAGFEKASIVFSSNNPDIKVTTDNETTLVPAGDAMLGYSGELEYFLECLKNGTQPEKCMPESALKTIEICYQHI